MSRAHRLFAGAGLLAVLSLPAPGRAENAVVFPPSGEVFHDLRADPRQVQLAALYYRQSGSDNGDIALGHSWGLLRGGTGPSLDWLWQWDIEGMAYSRFRLDKGVNEFQVVDFFANLPLEVRHGAVSGKLTLFHESSHLGDDYIRRTGNQGVRYSVNGLRALASWEPLGRLRLYGGGSYLLDETPTQGRGQAQGGLELESRVHHADGSLPYCLYLAEDLQSRASTAWNPDSHTVAGLLLGIRDFERAMRFFLGYYTGHSPFGQFYTQREDHFEIGLGFDF